MPAVRSARATAKPAVIAHRDGAINLRVAGPAETALRRTIRSFAERYERTTELARERGVDIESVADADLRALWNEAKA